MKIAVTGATGFVGRPLVATLRERGDTVLALSRDAARAKSVLGDVTIVEADLEARGAWWEALAGVDAIVHLAGEPIAARRWDARQKQKIRDSRVEATRTLVEAIGALPEAQRPRALVSTSGVDYYPFANEELFDDDEVTESDPPSESFLGRVCRDWEAEALGAEALGLRVARMRLGLVLGKGGALEKMTTPFRWFVGGRIGHGRQWLPWIHIDDAVAAFAAATSDARYAGAINVVTDSARNAELAKALGAALHRPALVPVPAFALKLAAGEMAEYVLHGRRVVPAKLRELGFAWKHPELAAALATLA